jgi:hypothetical protein
VESKPQAKTDKNQKVDKNKDKKEAKQDSTRDKVNDDDDHFILKLDKMNPVLSRRMKLPKNAL